MASTSVAAADWSATPDALVRSFHRDYTTWNDAAVARSSGRHSSSAMDETQREYDELLKKYAFPGFQGEPIAYGSQSFHAPTSERIVSASIDGDRALVKTIFEADVYSPEYEYELERQNGRWYLTEVYFVDETGRYPSL